MTNPPPTGDVEPHLFESSLSDLNHSGYHKRPTTETGNPCNPDCICAECGKTKREHPDTAAVDERSVTEPVTDTFSPGFRERHEQIARQLQAAEKERNAAVAALEQALDRMETAFNGLNSGDETSAQALWFGKEELEEFLAALTPSTDSAEVEP